MGHEIILFGHGGSENHGCEAIVRSTAQILKKSSVYKDLVLATPATNQDLFYGLDKVCTVEDVKPGKRNLDFFKAYLSMKFRGRYEDLDTYRFFEVLRRHKNAKLAFSIGGDNYCYGNNIVLARQHQIFREAGLKTILWGCSVEPEVLKNKRDYEDLSQYSYILARESLTYEALIQGGLKNVQLFPDPAFTLNCMEVSLPLDNLVGINLSPMIMECEGDKKGIAFSNFDALISYILNSTNYNIALIPHVIWNQRDDRRPLQILYEKYRSTNRVLMVEDTDAEHIKGYISKCRYMIAARTHASIAAYSTCVPTLVVGYSVKAKGIAKDIFGTYDDYVIPVQSLQSAHDLLDGFLWLVAHEAQIKKHLQTIMPAYIGRAWQAGEKLKEIACL